LFLVLAGRVKVFCTAENGTQTLLRIVSPEGFFGETAIVPGNHALRESAIALDCTQLMGWTDEEIRQQIEREPKLALALFDYFNACNSVHRNRVLAFAGYKTGMRVALALCDLAREIGSQVESGAMRISGLTHQAIGDYVGTTREIVTLEMNHLRRLGFLEYSRRFMDIHAGALAEWIREQGVTVGAGPAAPAMRAGM
jgi:CRP/FNR family transcriptional regulator, cyclic AMP receptor protein